MTKCKEIFLIMKKILIGVILLLSCQFILADDYTPPPMPQDLPITQKKLWALFFSEFDKTAIERDIGFVIGNSLEHGNLTIQDLQDFFNHSEINKRIQEGKEALLDLKHSNLSKKKFEWLTYDIQSEQINFINSLIAKSPPRKYKQHEAEVMAKNITAGKITISSHSSPGENFLADRLYNRSLYQALEQDNHQVNEKEEVKQLIKKLIADTKKTIDKAYYYSVRQFISLNKDRVVLIENERNNKPASEYLQQHFEEKKRKVYFKNPDNFPFFLNSDVDKLSQNHKIQATPLPNIAYQFMLVKNNKYFNLAFRNKDNSIKTLRLEDIIIQAVVTTSP